MERKKLTVLAAATAAVLTLAAPAARASTETLDCAKLWLFRSEPQYRNWRCVPKNNVWVNGSKWWASAMTIVPPLSPDQVGDWSSRIVKCFCPGSYFPVRAVYWKTYTRETGEPYPTEVYYFNTFSCTDPISGGR